MRVTEKGNGCKNDYSCPKINKSLLENSAMKELFHLNEIYMTRRMQQATHYTYREFAYAGLSKYL